MVRLFGDEPLCPGLLSLLIQARVQGRLEGVSSLIKGQRGLKCSTAGGMHSMKRSASGNPTCPLSKKEKLVWSCCKTGLKQQKPETHRPLGDPRQVTYIFLLTKKPYQCSGVPSSGHAATIIAFWNVIATYCDICLYNDVLGQWHLAHYGQFTHNTEFYPLLPSAQKERRTIEQSLLYIDGLHFLMDSANFTIDHNHTIYTKCYPGV